MAAVVPVGAAVFLLDVASAKSPPGVPVPYDDSKDKVARSLEAVGLIERHHVGQRKGAVLTKLGKEVVDGFTMVKF